MSTAALALRERARVAWRAHAAKFNALPARERAAVLLAGLALAAGLEFLFVQPMIARAEFVAASVQEQAQAAEAERMRAASERASLHDGLQQQLREQQQALQALGQGEAGSERLGPWLQRNLAGHGVRVVALRELASEALPTITASDGGDAAAADATPPAGPGLARHRVELTLEGSAAALIESVRALDARARPARIERVQLTGNDDTAVRALIVLVLTSQEPSWFVW